MKCKIIRDLLPLYIDRMTSDESNWEIEEHLAICGECSNFYEEMSGEIHTVMPVTDDEIEEINLIKKMNKKRKKRVIATGGGIMAMLVIMAALFCRVPRPVNYEDVKFTYGVRENKVYFEMDTIGQEIIFSGGVEEENGYLKVLALKKMPGAKSEVRWEDEIGTEEKPCIWEIEFKDRTMVIENGMLVKEEN